MGHSVPRIVLLSLALAVATSAVAAPDLSALPAVEARSLAKETLSLPGDLQGTRNLVVISFERSQSADMDTWTGTVRSVREERPGVDGYLLLIMGDLPRALRVVIEAAMRGQVSDAAERERFLLMYGDRDSFLSDMGIDDTSSILVVLLDGSGQPTWQWRGPHSDEAAAALEIALTPG